MSSEMSAKGETHTTSDARWTIGFWAGGSAIGASAGAVLALILFPGAAFGLHRIGQFDWKLVGFAFAIAVPMGLSQWLVLFHILEHRIANGRGFLHLWIPVTSVGFAVMILPLWWWDALMFFLTPWWLAVPMFPGMLLLGVSQRFLLHRLIGGKITWVLLTMLGAAIGVILGLVAALFLMPIPLELTWSFVTGATIGLLQGIALVSSLADDRSEESDAS